MICALLDFENVKPQTSYWNGFPTFRCKMPHLPSDVPPMMTFELLQAIIPLSRSYFPHTGTNLYLLDSVENCHNNTNQNEIFINHLDNEGWRWYPQLRGDDIEIDSDGVGGKNTNQAGITTFTSDLNMKAVKVYMTTKQDYLYFKLEDKGDTLTNGNRNIVENAKMIIRLTFDKTQNDYQPKRIML
jgi:hypothetical protein